MYNGNGKERGVNMFYNSDYYNLVLKLMLLDYEKKGITTEQAEELYNKWKIATIFKNGKAVFISEQRGI
jgi:hypothetical protein